MSTPVIQRFSTHVHIRGRHCASFVHPRDAATFVDARTANGPYKRGDFSLTDADGRAVIGVSSHGYNVLETLRRTKP